MANEERETYWIADPIDTIVLLEIFVSMVFKRQEVPTIGRDTLTCKYTWSRADPIYL